MPSLRQDHSEIKLVPASRREMWERRAKEGTRCGYEDGRGRCTSLVTVARWNPTTREVDHYCETHASHFSV